MIKRLGPKAGQESVWDYPRPPRVEASQKRVRIYLSGRYLVDSQRAFRVLETSHPPVYYVPQEDIQMQFLVKEAKTSFCEFKGQAAYWSIRVEGAELKYVAWSYPDPSDRFSQIKNYLAFYPSKMDACFLDDEQITAQEGDFYGGWISSDIVGPFKGGTGTWGW